MQYNEQEQQYLLLASQFRNELATINAQIEDLTSRKEHIEAILSTTDLDIDVEFKPDVDVDEFLSRPERTEGNNDERAAVDQALVDLLANQPGLGRASINEKLEVLGWSPWDVDKSLKRCKNAGKIRREGQTRTALWFAKEES